MDAIIRVDDVSKSFKTKGRVVDAVKHLNLAIEKGDVYGVIGLSGAGKSTFVRCLNLLEKPTSGKILIEEEDLTTLSKRKLRKKRQEIGMIFQHFNLLMQKNVLDNVIFPLKIAGVKRKDAVKRARDVLQIVGLEDKEKAYPAELSGGQKQRVAIARVLANNPKIILCDEATSALDPQTTKAILRLLKDINKSLGITIVVITYEMDVIQEICNKVAVLENGEIVENGSVGEIFAAPKTQATRQLVFADTIPKGNLENTNSVRIIFTNQEATEPIIANLILQYKVPINILYANTKNIDGKAVGEMLIELPKEKEMEEKIMKTLREKNIIVEEVG